MVLTPSSVKNLRIIRSRVRIFSQLKSHTQWQLCLLKSFELRTKVLMYRRRCKIKHQINSDIDRILFGLNIVTLGEAHLFYLYTDYIKRKSITFCICLKCCILFLQILLLCTIKYFNMWRKSSVSA